MTLGQGKIFFLRKLPKVKNTGKNGINFTTLK